MSPDPMLPDGRYDALVIAADAADDGRLRLELVVVGGPHKGEVAEVLGPGVEHDPLDLLGLPATVAVVDGEPSVSFD